MASRAPLCSLPDLRLVGNTAVFYLGESIASDHHLGELLQCFGGMVSQRMATPVQGMGEPLNNYEQVRTATRTMINPTLFGLKRSKVTISTVGIIPRILQVRISSSQGLVMHKCLHTMSRGHASAAVRHCSLPAGQRQHTST